MIDWNALALTIWFGDSQEECVCEDTGDEVILMKDRSGQVIGHLTPIAPALSDAGPYRLPPLAARSLLACPRGYPG